MGEGRPSENSGLRARYLELCEQSLVRPNSEVLRMFGPSPRSIRALDFRRNYLGDAGGKAMAACLRLLPELLDLNLRSNGLRDGAITFLCGSLAGHPKLATLDVSDNEINDAHGGRALLSLVTENFLITRLRCDNSRMTEKTKGLILKTVSSNCGNEPKGNLRKQAYESVPAEPTSRAATPAPAATGEEET